MRPETGRATGSQGAAVDEPEAQSSLALKPVLHQLARKRSRILDLGPAVGSNVAFFSSFDCKLYIADLYRSLRAQRSLRPGDAAALRRTLEEQLPGRGGGFDLILAWDLLNYLEPLEIEILGSHLSRLTPPSSTLFAMIWTRPSIPEQPMILSISSPERLLYASSTSGRREAPRYKEPDLGRLLRGFSVEASFLLRHGMQEYLLTRDPSPAAAPRA